MMLEIEVVAQKMISELSISEQLRFTVGTFKEMLSDPDYLYDDHYMHRHIDGKVHCNFGGSLIRHVLGKEYDCVPYLFFDPVEGPIFSSVVNDMNMLSYGNIRDVFRKTDDKTYKKVFDKTGFEMDRKIGIKDRLDKYIEMADYIKSKGFWASLDKKVLMTLVDKKLKGLSKTGNRRTVS